MRKWAERIEQRRKAGASPDDIAWYVAMACRQHVGRLSLTTEERRSFNHFFPSPDTDAAYRARCAWTRQRQWQLRTEVLHGMTEMEAFDELPRAIRDALRDDSIGLSRVALAKLRSGQSEARVLKEVRPFDAERYVLALTKI